jgi:hypothetical protein
MAFISHPVFNILILENNLTVVAHLLRAFNRAGVAIHPIIVPNSHLVETYINPSNLIYDYILLDQASPTGSFHIFDIAKFGPSRVIGISSVASQNRQLFNRGVKYVIDKDYQNLDRFSSNVVKIISQCR